MTFQEDEGFIEPDSVWIDKEENNARNLSPFGRVIVTAVDARGYVYFSNKIIIQCMSRKDFLFTFTKGE